MNAFANKYYINIISTNKTVDKGFYNHTHDGPYVIMWLQTVVFISSSLKRGTSGNLWCETEVA